MRFRAALTLGVAVAALPTVSCSTTVLREHACSRTEFIQVRFGMNESEVRQVLGSTCDIDGYGAGYYDSWYTDRQVIVSFDASGKVIGVSIPKRHVAGSGS